MGEWNKHVADIGQERERQSAEQRDHTRAPPPQPAEIAEAIGGDDWQQYEARPDEAVECDDEGRETGFDPLARGDEAERPEEGSTGPAHQTPRCRRAWGRRAIHSDARV